MFSNLKLRNRMLVGYSIPITLLVGIGAIVYSSADRVYQAFRQTNISKTALLGADAMAIGTSKMERGVRGYLLTKNDSYLQVYNQALKSARDGAESAKEALENESQKNRLNKMSELIEELDRFNQQMIGLMRSGKSDEALKMFSNFKSRDIAREVDALSANFNAQESAFLQESTKSAQASINFLIASTILGTLIAIGIAIAAALLISSGISKTINQAVQAIREASPFGHRQFVIRNCCHHRATRTHRSAAGCFS